MKKTSFLLFLFLVTILNILGGFRAGTLVKTPSGQVPIETLHVGDLVLSWAQDRSVVYKVVNKQSKIEHNCYCIEIAGQQIVMSANQKFYVANEDVWKKACDLTTQDLLYCAHGEHATIDDVYQLEWDTEFFDITVEKAHNFYVTKQMILVHNAAPLVIGLSWAIGQGAIEFAGCSLGIGILGCLLGLELRKDGKNKQDTPHIGDFGITFEASTDSSDAVFYKDSEKKEDDKSTDSSDAPKERDKKERAPGRPTENDGFIPSKNWDGKKVPHPKTGQYGYPDKDGKVWIPTGAGPLAHGGPHWDVVDRNGKSYKNVLPGGKIRGAK